MPQYRIEPFVYSKVEHPAAATPVYIDFPDEEPGAIRVITEYVGNLDGGTAKRAQCGIRRGSERYYCETVTLSTNAQDWVASTVTVVCPSDWVPFIYFGGLTVGQTYILNIFGYYMIPEE